MESCAATCIVRKQADRRAEKGSALHPSIDVTQVGGPDHSSIATENCGQDEYDDRVSYVDQEAHWLRPARSVPSSCVGSRMLLESCIVQLDLTRLPAIRAL